MDKGNLSQLDDDLFRVVWSQLGESIYYLIKLVQYLDYFPGTIPWYWLGSCTSTAFSGAAVLLSHG